MKTAKLLELSQLIVKHSIKMKRNENVLIKADIESIPLVKTLVKTIHLNKGIPYVQLRDEDIVRELMIDAKEEYFDKLASWNETIHKSIDSCIYIVAERNDSYLEDVTLEIKKMSSKKLKKSSDIIIDEKKWVLLNYPTHGLAQRANMSYERFYNYLLEVCTVNYKEMTENLKPLKELMEKTDKVRIVGDETNLTFSIKDIPAIICAGTANLPDGEIFTAPIKTSVNGTIKYNTTSSYQGEIFKNVKFKFKNGKIIEATADNNTTKLNQILDTDEGARYIGEFALGVNPLILHPMGDILFDEKIAGSLHFTPGQCYSGEADNGNASSIHWDLVLIQRPEYGGGEIYFDDVLVRKDGIFLDSKLKKINYNQ